MDLKGAPETPAVVSEKGREFVPIGVQTTVAKESGGEKIPQPAEKAADPKEGATVGTVQVATTPDGAEVYADGKFVGNAPPAETERGKAHSESRTGRTKSGAEESLSRQVQRRN